jgi:hypothetical protein
MLRPGFEPGSPARKAGMIDRSTLSEPEEKATSTFINLSRSLFTPHISTQKINTPNKKGTYIPILPKRIYMNEHTFFYGTSRYTNKRDYLNGPKE